MKQPASHALLLLFTLIRLAGFSQNSARPTQFSSFPDVINCSETMLSNVFNNTPGQNIHLDFSDNFSFAGTVVNNVVKFNNLQGVVIRSPYFNNTVFSVSRIIHKDNTVTYTGRIINKNYFDGYELKKNATGNYQFHKVETDRVIQDCSQ